MIVPQFWAEAKHRERIGGKQTTIRRFGWSDESPAAAQAHAERRVREALEQCRAGTLRTRRELKIAYNGAEGLPIREEILARHGETVLTRNSYGAQCLNTPNVLFLDIDYSEPKPVLPCFITLVVLAAMAGVVYGLANQYWTIAGISAAILMLVFFAFDRIRRRLTNSARRQEPRIRDRISRFLELHPDWLLRVYRSPNGFRLLAMHALFEPRSPEVEGAFRELGVDPVYAIMCRNQNCFRARVSPKPWRIGMDERYRPRPGVWPVNPYWLPIRAAWVERYENLSREFASCQFVDEMGTGRSISATVAVRDLHDRLSRATSGLPMA